MATPLTYFQPRSTIFYPTGQALPKVHASESFALFGDTRAPVKVYTNFRDGLLASEPHYRLPNGRWSGGGNFYCYHAAQQHSEPSSKKFYYKNGPYWEGGIGTVSPCPISSWANSTTPFVPSLTQAMADASAYYATGYARARPGNPVANAGQFFAELRDLPKPIGYGFLRRYQRLVRKSGGILASIPRVLMGELQGFRSLGSEYLNLVFGWEPFVRDLRQMYHLWHDIDKRMAQLIRENGKSIRRKAQVARESDISDSKTTYAYAFGGVPYAPPNWTSSAGSIQTITTRWSNKVWFSGSFRYYIPDVGSSLWNKRARLALFGALPTPELLWEVMPWSWLIDWFVNVGDIISNASPNAVDNLTTDYSFIMRQYRWEKTYHVTTWHSARDDFGGIPPSKGSTAIGSWWKAYNGTHVSSESWEIKTRCGGGNPFGLNIQLPDLSARQLAILAALGISRSKVR